MTSRLSSLLLIVCVCLLACSCSMAMPANKSSGELKQLKFQHAIISAILSDAICVKSPEFATPVRTAVEVERSGTLHVARVANQVKADPRIVSFVNLPWLSSSDERRRPVYGAAAHGPPK